MILKPVEDLPDRKHYNGRHYYELARELERTITTMQHDTWYKVLDCPYNNSNDYYRAICNASRQLNYPILIKMRNGSIYIRRTK
jgi:hypothetical protein